MDKENKSDESLKKKSISIPILDRRPTFENDIGVYKEDEAWLVAQMRERGELFVAGAFVTKDIAMEAAIEFKKELEDMFNRSV